MECFSCNGMFVIEKLKNINIEMYIYKKKDAF